MILVAVLKQVILTEHNAESQNIKIWKIVCQSMLILQHNFALLDLETADLHR